MIKLIAIDVDGTLINSKERINPRDKKAIMMAKEEGVHICIATGRPYKGIVKYLKELNIMDTDNFSITNNGSYIQRNSDGELVFENSLSKDDIGVILDHLSGYESLEPCVINDDEFTCMTKPTRPRIFTDSAYIEMPILPGDFSSLKDDDSFAKVLGYGDEEVLQRWIKNNPKGIPGFSSVLATPDCYEVMPLGISKGSGLKNLAEKFGYKPSEVMCFGDELNDKEMFEFAGLSIAMGNANREIKKIADYITSSCEEDGIYHAIKNLVL